MVAHHRPALLEIADALCAHDELEGHAVTRIVARYADVSERRGAVRIAPQR